MNILSDFSRDSSVLEEPTGGYEWWYFDAISRDGTYSLVVIFYKGNPFSTRYNSRIQDPEDHPKPCQHPAVSISIYEEGEPIYYSFTEYGEPDSHFGKEEVRVETGSHRMKGHLENGTLSYRLQLRETLPSGDRLSASITFESPDTATPFAGGDNGGDDPKAGHSWNLVQPRASVKAAIRIWEAGSEERRISFEGRGYHDHNTGREPMREEFSDWYWGRFHFETTTLVYYVMNRQKTEQHNAWLFDTENGQIIERLDDIELQDRGWTLFGLKTARKIGLRSDNAEVRIQQSRLMDNGPFYQRYLSDAFMNIPGRDLVESGTGISEYIRPARIHSRIFWPFVNMRIRYAAEKPHWVQRSPVLYRWTW